MFGFILSPQNALSRVCDTCCLPCCLSRWGGREIGGWAGRTTAQDSLSEDNRPSESLYLFILITFLSLLLSASSFVLNLKASPSPFNYCAFDWQEQRTEKKRKLSPSCPIWHNIMNVWWPVYFFLDNLNIWRWNVEFKNIMPESREGEEEEKKKKGS